MPVVIIIIVVVAVAVLAGVVSFNRLVRLRNRVASAWSQITVQLTRRHDLVPNLVETVKGYAAHEQQTLQAVIQARNAAVAAQQGRPASQAQAEDVLTGALRQLFALSEAYPDLKANDNFLNLQKELASTEDRISLARQSYNDTVMTYVTKVQSFPSNVVAATFGFETPEYFEAEAGSAEVPEAQF